MACFNCDSTDFGTVHLDGLGIVRSCADCGVTEEASASEIALFIEENAGYGLHRAAA
jgi:hypothetical protein